VIAAPPAGWSSDPFTLTGRNGYLYGRGATDNKGPVLAAACAAASLLGRRALEIDFVFLVEGEEEAGSGGFEAAVRRNKVRQIKTRRKHGGCSSLRSKSLIGHIDAILVSNSTWIAEDPPCITYGLRGVVHCGLEVSADAIQKVLRQ
jgi:di- and tripeptidase